jgi:hypothetical protein
VLAAVRTEVAVVLLVAAVEFDQLLVVFGKGAGGQIGEPFGDRAAQVVRPDFQTFIGRGFFFAHEG